MPVSRSRIAGAALLVVGMVGVAVRIWIWWSSTGTGDVPTWETFGQEIDEHGLRYAYANLDRFNHPPLMGLYAAEAWQAAGSLSEFARLIKIPGLVGDLVVLGILTRVGGLRLFAAYATAPTAVLVTSYHGNTDGLYVALVLVAALAFDRKQFFWAGLAFGGALNVKALPIVLLPLLVIALPDRRAVLRCGGGLALGLIPYLPLLFGSAGDMYSQILAYNSVRQDWGLLAFLLPASGSEELGDVAAPAGDAVVASGRYVLLAAIVSLAVACRLRLRLRMVEQFAIGASLFLILAPGFGAQYTLLVTPLLFLVSLPYALAFTWLAGAAIALRYWTLLGSEYSFLSARNRLNRQVAGELGVLAWASLIVFVWQRLAEAMQSARSSGSGGRDSPAGSGRP